MRMVSRLKYLRLAPRKVRAVLDVIRGLDLDAAEAQLLHLPKRAAQPILKLLKSAVANALNNYAVKKEDLYIKEFFADEGPTLYRWSPRAFGRATPIRKRSSHLTIVLETKKGVLKKKTEGKVPPLETKEEIKSSKKPEKFEEKKKAKEDLKLKRKEGFMKRIFRRKTI